MGFYRQGMPQPLDRDGVKAAVISFIAAEEIALVERAFDPFEVDDPCPLNAGRPHRAIASCGEVVCRHCSKVFWR